MIDRNLRHRFYKQVPQVLDEGLLEEFAARHDVVLLEDLEARALDTVIDLYELWEVSLGTLLFICGCRKEHQSQHYVVSLSHEFLRQLNFLHKSPNLRL